jgi:REP element-mobilizing transposase RayT
MPRPIRIEYPNALYHVINRGRARCNIFHGDVYYQSFLKTIEEAHTRFGLVVHAYCLMSNHYHLLVETPNANLGRIMRHINGTYTQKYNRLKNTDGPLFRGRYKAILAEESQYLLVLSRYIHRNPIETKMKMVKNLQDYAWSSYPYYLNVKNNAPDWLNMERTLKMFSGGDDPLKNYEIFVNSTDENQLMSKIYQKRNIPAILGGKNFKEKILFQKLVDDSNKREQVLNRINKNQQLTIDQIVDLVAEIFMVEKSSVINRSDGCQAQNQPRALAMFLCQRYQDLTLSKIADIFSLKSMGSVSKAISRIEKILNDGGFDKEFKLIRSRLWLMEET